MTQWQQELEVALTASRRAADLAARMQPGIVSSAKSDGSPVTEADKSCEALIAETIAKAFPEDGMLGEEGVAAQSSNGRRWIIDPIDGTRDYLRGIPLWANLIALEADGEIVAGVVNLPGMGSIYTATRGGGAFANGARIKASSKERLEEAVACVNGLNRIDTLPFRDRLLQHLPQFWAVRCLGGASDAMMVAAGQADLWIEPVAAPWDLAPLKIIIEEAGGCFFTFDRRSTIYAGHCIACAPGLQRAIGALLD